jgi:heat shock protein HslJ
MRAPSSPTRSRRRRLGLVAVALLAAAGLAGCSPDEDDTKVGTAGLPDLAESLMAETWVLELEDNPDLVHEVMDDGAGAESIVLERSVTLTFPSDDEAAGQAPCNTYTAGVELDGDDGLTFGTIAVTQMACDPEVSSLEDTYLSALEEVTTADTTDRDRLVLTADGIRLSYTALDEDDDDGA